MLLFSFFISVIAKHCPLLLILLHICTLFNRVSVVDSVAHLKVLQSVPLCSTESLVAHFTASHISTSLTRPSHAHQLIQLCIVFWNFLLLTVHPLILIRKGIVLTYSPCLRGLYVSGFSSTTSVLSCWPDSTPMSNLIRYPFRQQIFARFGKT